MTGDAERIPVVGSRWRHLKRGTNYTLLTRGVELQTTAYLGEGGQVAVYQGDDGRIWVRRQADFDDGRFERLSDADIPAPDDLKAMLYELILCAGAAGYGCGSQSLTAARQRLEQHVAAQDAKIAAMTAERDRLRTVAIGHSERADNNEARVAELEGALKPFHEMNVELEKQYADYPDHSGLMASGSRDLRHADFRKATAALSSTPSNEG